MAEASQDADTGEASEILRGGLAEQVIARHTQLGLTLPAPVGAALRKVPPHTTAKAWARFCAKTVVTKNHVIWVGALSRATGRFTTFGDLDLELADHPPTVTATRWLWSVWNGPIERLRRPRRRRASRRVEPAAVRPAQKHRVRQRSDKQWLHATPDSRLKTSPERSHLDTLRA